MQNQFTQTKTKTKTKVIILTIGALTILAAAGIFGYNYLNQPSTPTGYGYVFPCYDSDGGQNAYEKGTAGIKSPAIVKSMTDVCSYTKRFFGARRSNVTEFYCEQNQIKSKNVPCSKGCNDGACIK